MTKQFKLSLFIFRRDLRLIDNTALKEAMDASETVIPCFIFDDRQIKDNTYFSENAFLFMLQSLAELKNDIQNKKGHLYFFKGIAESCVEKLIHALPIEALFFNRDYTPFSHRRDHAIRKIAEKNGRLFFSLPDALLHEPEAVFKKDRSPYTIFTPFYNQAATLPVKPIKKIIQYSFYNEKIALSDELILAYYLEKYSKNSSFLGGRSEGLALLSAMKKKKNYEKNRDFPSINATSHLSPHHKFGTLSIRESYYAIKDTTFKKELYWRDFFTHIAFHYAKVFSGAFHEKYNRIPWVNNKKHFQRWCEGKTGFPIVDAGMRELNETGYMHNRVRMIVSSFLVKDLHIDWRWGEHYFATKLVDYDPAVNNGNWQWAASTGCDAQPYFRIFNPALQQKRFDVEEKYIRYWVPELNTKKYPLPIVDHAAAGVFSKKLFQLKEEK
ncbi:MAG: deoxyribodipyrimidine photo-lyase [Coxiellaceae bacterium]|nr:deoxyribodipyrimidine photo-lyase [Coxiellaceae bacterium]